MTTDNKYNGWTNYATWRINLEILNGYEPYSKEVYDISEELKAYVEDYIDLSCEDGLAKDYAMAFISEVNYYEIAQNIFDEREVENE